MLRVTVTRSINIIFALLTCQLFLGMVKQIKVVLLLKNRRKLVLIQFKK